MRAAACWMALFFMFAGCVGQSPDRGAAADDLQASDPGNGGNLAVEPSGELRENQTMPALKSNGIVVLENCSGAVPSLNWPREALPWPAPVGYENDHPAPSARMFAFRCDAMDALGLATFYDISFGLLAHSNVSRPAPFDEVEYDSAVVALETYISPPEAAALLAAHGFGPSMDALVRVMDVDTGTPSVQLESETGRVGVLAPRVMYEEEPDVPIVPQAWLVVYGDTMSAVKVSVAGLSDGLALQGVWNATGSNAFAAWMPGVGPGLPALASYMHSTQIELEVVS